MYGSQMVVEVNLLTPAFVLILHRETMAVDELSQDFLRVLLETGGEASTTKIRSKTGMTRGQVNHRFKKLSNLDWINIERAESGKGERTPPKVAVLTEEGDQAIRSGEAGSKVLSEETDEEEEINVSKDQIESFQNEIDSVKNRLNVVVEQLNNGETRVKQESENESTGSEINEERVQKLEREVARLRETVELLNEAVSESDSEEEKSEDNTNDINKEVIQDLRDQQEYLEEWMDVAQRHMIAMRIYMDENDENFDEYLEEAADKE
jgi:DNA-binding MarR family transcriptional regulator